MKQQRCLPLNHLYIWARASSELETFLFKHSSKGLWEQYWRYLTYSGYNPPKYVLDAAKEALDRVDCNQYAPTKVITSIFNAELGRV